MVRSAVGTVLDATRLGKQARNLRRWRVTKASARERLVDAAFDLFDERGYEQTTVDEIAERAGVGRTTFFRHYRSKEDVIFPDHDRLLDAIAQRLAEASSASPVVAVSDAVRLVLLRYLEEGDQARRRYVLTSRVAALRDREIATLAKYQRLFREFIVAESMATADPAADPTLGAELIAACIVSAHNHVLRRWLRGEADDPLAELDAAMARVLGLFSGSGLGSQFAADGTTVVVFSSKDSIEELLPSIRKAVESSRSRRARL
jgi:AcrR family transcriptional regulator